MGLVADKIIYVLEEDLDITIKSFDDKIELESIQMVELVVYLEEEFRIVIPDEDVIKFKTVKGIIDYINKKTNG